MILPRQIEILSEQEGCFASAFAFKCVGTCNPLHTDLCTQDLQLTWNQDGGFLILLGAYLWVVSVCHKFLVSSLCLFPIII
jgi:hypothetical protein